MILFGGLFSLFSSNRSGSIFKEIAFWHGFVFTSIFNVAVVYAIVYFPDWMWMYFLEDSHNSLAELFYLFVFLYYLPYALGYYLGRDFKARSLSVWALLMVSMVLAEAWVVMHLFDRYSVIGTREQFLTGSAVSLLGPDNPIALVMNSSVAAMIIYFIAVAFWFKRRPGASV